MGLTQDDAIAKPTENKPDAINAKDIGQVNADFAKHITSHSFLDLLFYKKLCGWREVTESQTRNTPFGAEDILRKEYVINENARICNEACANYVRSHIEACINQLTTTSKLDKDQIYNEWDGLFFDLVYGLIDNYFDDGNSFEIKSYTKIPNITTYAISFNTITYKCLDGFTLEELARNQLTQTLIKSGFDPSDTQKRASGILGMIGGIFSAKKKAE